MEFRAEVRGGDFGRAIEGDGRALRKALTQGLAKAGRDTRAEMLRDFQSRLRTGRRGVGARSLEGLVTVRQKPRTGFVSWTPRVWVQSRATYKRGGVRQRPVDLFAVFDAGATVRAAAGRFLAIPTANAPWKQGRGGARKATPKEAAAMGVKVDLVRLTPSRMLLVDPRTKAVLWVLVRQVRLAPRLSLDAIFRRNADRITDHVGAILDAELARNRSR